MGVAPDLGPAAGEGDGPPRRREEATMLDDERATRDASGSQEPEQAEPPLLSKDEAIAEVRRWFERYHIDPNQIFARAGNLIVRYGDLIPHLQQETSEGQLLLRAISRGRAIRRSQGAPQGESETPS